MKIHPADKAFGDYIKAKTGNKCKYCGRNGRMETSHFHSRRKASTRFDEENVACLCSTCHRYFHEHPNIHVDWMKKRLGSERYELLNIRAEQIMKVNRKDVTKEYREKLKTLKDERD